MARSDQENPITHDDIEAHYASLFGAPDERHVYRTKTHSFAVLCWSPQKTGEDVYIFATVGAYAAMGTPTERCEFFFGLTEKPAGVADSIAEVALDGNGTGRVPSSGDTVTLAFALWDGTRATSYMFTDGGDEIVPRLRRNATVVEFIQLVPLFADEVDYKKAHGEEALWRHFEDNHVAYWDPDRISSLSDG
ncbi:MAG: hypothetical protein CSA72_08555 [Rhodobacterales bacterium]|nr:MAG: hypothetical protein CSA72_08555 [Rhodobacterales bacterium]